LTSDNEKGWTIASTRTDQRSQQQQEINNRNNDKGSTMLRKKKAQHGRWPLMTMSTKNKAQVQQEMLAVNNNVDKK
jgi:hypothetical protein